jgi:hypothetical protein
MAVVFLAVRVLLILVTAISRPSRPRRPADPLGPVRPVLLGLSVIVWLCVLAGAAMFFGG